MSRSPALGVAAYEVETSFAEDFSNFGTKIVTAAPIELSGFQQPILRSERVTAYRNQVMPGFKGAKRGEFRTRHYLTGHGSTCAGVVTPNDLETLLGIALGRGDQDVTPASSAGGTLAIAGGTLTSIKVAQAAGFAVGAIARAGTLGNGRGNGQPFVVGAHAAGAITPLTQLPDALADEEQVFAPVNISIPESPTANAIKSTRWLLQTANKQVEAHGCYPRSYTITITNGQVPVIEITWGCAWWDWANEMFPLPGNMQAHTAAIVAGGSFFFAPVGTAERRELVPVQFALTHQMNVVEVTGPGGQHSHQDVIGCVRGRDEITVEITCDARDADTHELGEYWDGAGAYHLLYGLSSVDSTAVALYLPYLVPDQNRPTQEDVEGLNRVKLRLLAGTGPNTTTELAASALRIAMG